MLNEKVANGFSLGNRAADAVYQTLDYGLETVSYVAEKVDHTWSARIDNASYGSGTKQYHSPISRTVEAFRQQVKRGLPFNVSLEALSAIMDAVSNDGAMDDREMLLEHMLVMISRLPKDSDISKTMTEKAVAMLWFDLPHPLATAVSPDHRFRSADGSGNNIWNPDLGKAGSYYGRSVGQVHPLPPNQLPSPDLLFDTLLKREKEVDHPAGLSSMFFAFANLVIHCIFNTDFENQFGFNKTSSYIDLALIYGNNLEEQKGVRAFDGYGHIWNDTFADSRLLRMPPASPALLVLFCRNHNFVADRLLQINERGQWNKDLTKLSDKDREQQDEEIFQTARLIMCGFFTTVIFSDYLTSILGLVRDGNSWSLNPLETIRADNHSLVERGQGNLLSLEFVALYHFHATISTADEKWVEAMFRRMFGDKPWDDITPEEYKGKIKGMVQMAKSNPNPPKTWTFGGMTRDPVTGMFPDDALARFIQEATYNPAGAFGARRTPHAMKIIEIMAIEQNRQWGTCSMNEFRKFLGLKPFSTFEEWNPNPEVAEAARRLYVHTDNLELYVGLQAEAAKEAVPGAGLCPGYTASRAILADAVALTRGDRFLTNDFTAYNLTSWGINECKRDTENASFGGMLGKVLMRALPDHFSADSVYTHFPLMTPTKMKKVLNELGLAEKYSFEKPPKRTPIVPITGYDEAKAILSSPSFKTVYPDNAELVIPGGRKGYIGSFNEQGKNSADRRVIREAFAGRSSDIAQHAKYMEKTVNDLIKSKSYTLVGGTKRSVNIVRDVLRFLPVHFVSNQIAGLPLKTDNEPTGFYYEQELLGMLENIHEFIFLEEKDASTKLARIDSVKKDCAELHRQVDRHLRALNGSGIPLAGIADSVMNLVMGKTTSAQPWLRRLNASGRDRTELVNDVLALSLLVSVEYSQALVHVVDTLLDPKYKVDMLKCTQSADPKNMEQLQSLISEALRLRLPLSGVYREVAADVKLSTGAGFVRGDRVFVSLKDANRDDTVFTNPDEVDTSVPLGSVLYGDGISRLLGEQWLLETMSPVIKTIFSLKNLTRARGTSGQLLSFESGLYGTTGHVSYFDKKQMPTPWASDMTINYEE